MEKDLRDFLLTIAHQYANASGCALSTVGRRARNDSGFFTRIAGADGSFTARTFDEVIVWFDKNWPEGHLKPDLSVRMVIPA